MKKIGFVSLGCAKNLTDTETMIGLLNERGYEITADESLADVIVVNTCAFIDSAKEESINAILEMAEYKKQNCELLVVTGCLAQRYMEDILKELPEVDIVLGTTKYSEIADAVDAFYKDGDKLKLVGDENETVDYNLPRVKSTPFYTAYLKIADGCDNFCTYCIIPKLRGKFKSRPKESILSEAKALAKEGVKELILVAQDTAYYGMDNKENNYFLKDLLKDLKNIEGIKWIRLQYCYPENITDELIDEIANNEKTVKYLDMPLQHVSDNVLKRMGRKSRYDEICTLIKKLRSKIKGLNIRTSLIVGFPGETEDDFNILKSFLKESKLDKVGVFTYSKEEGTPAFDYPDQIDEEIKTKRRDIIMSQQKETLAEVNGAKIGTITQVIIEGYDENEFCYVGRSACDTPDVDTLAYVYSQNELSVGDIVKIKIIDFDEYDMIGEAVI